LVDSPDAPDLAPHEVRREDVDRIVSRITQTSPRDAKLPTLQDIRGDLEQVPLADMLQILGVNRRSGVLSVTTSRGNAEVRLHEGEVIDATFRRVEGERALFRLLAERHGRFAFAPGDPSASRRITSPTSMLLMEGMRQLDEINRLRVLLAPAGELLALEDRAPLSLPSDFDWIAPSSPERPAAIRREVLSLLESPRAIDELLDEINAPDLAILSSLEDLASESLIRRIPLASLTSPLAPPEQFPVLRSLVTRLARPGFAPPPRLVIAAGMKGVRTLAHSIRRIMDIVAPAEPPPRAPLPRLLGTLRLGDDVEVAITALPTDEAFAPTWSLALPGAAAVIGLEDAAVAALQAHCEAVEVMLIGARTLVDPLDIAVPADVAALLRAALEKAAVQTS
jgi:hypothetical protein